MRSMTRLQQLPMGAVAAAFSLALAGCGDPAERASDEEADAETAEEAAAAARMELLDPAALAETAPDVFRAEFETSAGTFVIEATRAWAPEGADRFYTLVKNGYYDDGRFFRVIEGFMAQFGMHGDPAINQAWSQSSILDDPVVGSNTRGMVTFAMSGQPHSRTVQVFINFGDNSRLDEDGFAPFGRVVEGMDVVDRLHAGYGESTPRGSGPTQGAIAAQGNEYLAANFPELDYVISTRIADAGN